ncbi:hypothetical protein D777_02556 [Marinobacter nitratireducens]|uniref:Uncharacterized protein n=1 Tax=Marinobacter nitratireducens TaxID=1137280 RepID=A0A072MYZ9_9GAMM|nr:hypothetical protein D777_02556 [Marinobacter nitratireducens]
MAKKFLLRYKEIVIRTLLQMIKPGPRLRAFCVFRGQMLALMSFPLRV